MTDAAYAYPNGTRQAGAPSRPADPRRLRVVPDPTLQSATAVDEDTLSEPFLQVSDHAGRARTETETAPEGRIAGLWTASKTYWTPPAVFTDRPASLDELRAYARHAPWTAQQTGIVRRLGVGYNLGFAYPYTVWSRYKEWFAQRPTRMAVLLGGVKLISLTGPGYWAVHTLVYPVAQFAGHVFL